jgi:hypothetical protein
MTSELMMRWLFDVYCWWAMQSDLLAQVEREIGGLFIG